jgi:hypothetical protein
MKRKEQWMFVGATVMDLGHQATITHMQENTIDGREYVYYILCELPQKNHSNAYHPADISPLN